MPEFFSGHSVCPTYIDPSRAPDGKHGIYYYHYAPLIPKGKAVEDCLDIKEGFADWMLESLRRYTTNMNDSNIIARHIESPRETHQHSPSFRNEWLMFRGRHDPAPVHGRETNTRAGPVPDTWRGGALSLWTSAAPRIGGGRPVAMRILIDQKADLASVFTAL